MSELSELFRKLDIHTEKLGQTNQRLVEVVVRQEGIDDGMKRHGKRITTLEDDQKKTLISIIGTLMALVSSILYIAWRKMFG